MTSNRDSDNALVLSDSFAYVTAPGVSGVAPTDVSTAWNAVMKELGWLGEAGIGEARSNNSTDAFGVNGALIRKIRSNDSRTFKIECLETNALVLGLSRPGSSPSSVSSTNEQQTVTEGGSGLTSFTLTFDGQTTTSLIAAVSAAAMQSALEALSTIGSGNVTVSGSTSGPYTVTFVGDLAGTNVPVMTATPTGGSGTVTIATPVPGVSPLTTTSVKAYTGSDIRSFGLEEQFGDIVRRVYIDKGEAALTGDITDSHTGLRVFQYEIVCYPAADGTLYLDITNNPAEAV